MVFFHLKKKKKKRRSSHPMGLYPVEESVLKKGFENDMD